MASMEFPQNEVEVEHLEAKSMVEDVSMPPWFDSADERFIESEIPPEVRKIFQAAGINPD